MFPTTLVELIQRYSDEDRLGVTFIERSDAALFLSYKAIYNQAARALYTLQQRGLKSGDELVLQIEDNKSFIITFWACILGGITPVPLSIGNSDDHKRKLLNVWKILDNPYLCCKSELILRISKFALSEGEATVYTEIRRKTLQLDTDALPEQLGSIQLSNPQDLAFIQFSSGSTGSPKGVMLTHENLITNVAAIAAAADYSPDDSSFSWMPLTHDMGLIGFHLNPLFSGMGQVLMPTPLFIRNPSLWMSKVSEHRSTVLCSPNFGYRYLLKHMSKADTSQWDLSCVRIIYNGAEPISGDLGREFLLQLASFGLSSAAMCPVYGLAEASLAVSMSALEDQMLEVSIDRDQLKVGDHVKIDPEENAVSFVNVGKVINDVSLRIVNTDQQEVSDQVIGHIQIKGKNVTAGYHNQPEITKAILSPDGWLDTGDLGFTKDEALFVTGRAKDVFFSNGQNYYPHDIERIAEELSVVELNKFVITGHFNPDTQQEEVITFLLHRGDMTGFISLAEAIKRHINQQTGLQLTYVIPIKEIPKTTSGKLQRFKLLQQFKNGEFASVIAEIGKQVPSESNQANLFKSKTETEEKVHGYWQKLFGQAAFYQTDKFFEVGGNSLKAAELIMLIHRDLSVELDVNQLYRHQSITNQAQLIANSSKHVYQPFARLNLTAGKGSPFQKRLFYFAQANAGSTAYNVPVSFTLSPSVDEQKIKIGLQALIERHASLRSAFLLKEDEVHMQVHETVEVDFASTDQMPEASLAAFLAPFELSKPGLCRFRLVKEEGNRPVLFADFHHIICDGVSVSLLVQELQALYLGEELEEPGATYLDFAHWYDNKKDADAFEQQRQFWQTQLADKLPKLCLPTDHQRPLLFDHQGEKLSFKLDKTIARKLRSMAKAQGCSMHVLMGGIYSLFLHKLSGQKRQVIGLPVSVRNHVEVSKTIGMFVNNLPLVTEIDPSLSFLTYLDSLNEQVAMLLNHSDYPFDRMVRAFEEQQDPSRNPLFDTMFIYQNMDQPEAEAGGLQMEPQFINPGTSKYDFSQEIFDTGDGELPMCFEYAFALFERATIDRFIEQYKRLVDRILRNETAAIKDLSILSAEAFDQFVFTYNDSDITFEHATLLEAIEAQVNMNPMRAAMLLPDQSELSYHSLWQQSDLLARVLRKHGIGTGHIVPVCLGRTPKLIIALLGVMKSGAAYLPVDPQLPPQRIGFLLKDSKCLSVVTASAIPVHWESFSELVRILFVEELLEEGAIDLELPTLQPDHLAYVLYTSGTTGEPKGVKISHGALNNYISWAVDQYTDERNGSFALFTSISFDLTITSLFTPLASGHAIVILKDLGEEHQVIAMARHPKVEVIKLTPSHLTLLNDDNFKIKSEIKTIIVGGEAFNSDLARKVDQLFEGKVRIFNEYGPTEATVGCMIYQYDPSDPSGQVPIGIPAANTKIYLLDEFLNPVPQGVTGEIYISGKGVAAGYLFRPELTESRFLPDPFLDNQTMYKTGDYATRNTAGQLVYKGRIDEQLKINGYRIEPNEIIRSLTAHEAIRECAVGTRLINGQEKLFAYYLLGTGSSEVSEVALKAYLLERLPHYMVPMRLVELPSFPLTKNGKLDHEVLAEWEIPEANEDFELKDEEATAVLQRTWTEILKVEVQPTDNFFELGGDSIKAVQIAGRVREEGMVVSMQDILTYHSIEQLVGIGKVEWAFTKISQEPLTGFKKNTLIEQWFFDQNFENPSFYNQSALLSVNRPLDPGLLSAAFTTLIKHHDGLRLNVDKEKGLFFNEDLLSAPFHVEEERVEQDFQGQVQRIKSSLNIEESTPLKAVVLTQGQYQMYLLITAHHLVIDGVSWHILLHDLIKSYHYLETGNKPKLPLKTATLNQWQIELVSFLSDTSIEAQDYWKAVASESFEIPTQTDQQVWLNAGLKKYAAEIDAATTEVLIHQAHQKYSTNVSMLLNLALLKSLQSWLGGDTFVIEHENHGRHLEQVDTSRLIGWFTAMYPVRLILPKADTGEQILAIKEQMNAVPDQGLSYWNQYVHTPCQKGTIRSEVRFNYLGVFELEEGGLLSFVPQDLDLESAPENHLTTKIEINALIMNGTLHLEVCYHEKAFAAMDIQALADNLIKHLKDILSHIKDTDEVHFSPSDFDADLDQRELDELFM